MSKSTMVELVEELQKLKQTPEIVFMIEEAKAGEYHDYKNKKYDCGKMESYQRLKKLAKHYKSTHMNKLADRIADGEFDETADEEDKAFMKKEIFENSTPAQAEALSKMLNL